MKKVLVTGCFDILHAGHVATLQWARGQGDWLIVAVNSDDSVRRLKGEKRPVIPFLERSLVISALECVNLTVRMDEDTPERIIQYFRPAIMVKGPEFLGREQDIPCRHLVEIRIAPPLFTDHTTDIVRRLSCLK